MLLINQWRQKMSLRVTLNCQVKSGHIELLSSFLIQNLPHVRGFDGCMVVSVYFNDDKSEILLEEEWITVKHHHAYIKQIENNGTLAALASFLAAPPVIKYFKKEEM